MISNLYFSKNIDLFQKVKIFSGKISWNNTRTFQEFPTVSLDFTILYLRLQNIHCLHGTRGIQTLAFNSVFQWRLLSSPALSRVASPNHTFGVSLEVGVWGAGAGGATRCNRLVTSIGELHWAHSHVSWVQTGMLLGRRILAGGARVMMGGKHWVIKWAAE